LWLEDGISQRELAKRLGVMEPWALEMVRSMERDGLVMRTRDEADRRRLKLTLTEKARSLEPKMMNIASEVNRLMLEGLTESEEVLLKLLLKKVRERLAADTEVRGELDEDSV
jgi:DNA-binding MarR family transcriptional regulator